MSNFVANAADVSDDADIDYSEAVAVMSTIGVIDGVGNNSFDPDGTLTREQAAKLIAYMLLGENSEKLGVEGTSFNNVAATRWSAPAIEYCASLGIIAGDGNFCPAGKLTGYAFAKMLLTALGYKSDREGFTGNSWSINVATKALSEDVRLNAGLATMFGNAELSRQEAAQMALNAIKAPLVEYDNDNTISVNGAAVQINGGGAKFVTTTIAKQQNISRHTLTNSTVNFQNTGYTVEFGEKYFPKLCLVPESDDFERPSYTWVYENKELDTYPDNDVLAETYTEGVFCKTLLGRSNLEDYSFDYYVDGAANTKANAETILTRSTDDFGVSDSELTRFSKNSDTVRACFKKLTTGGTKYDSSAAADYSDEVLDLYNNKLLTGKTYNVYLDKYGYAIGVDLHTGEDNYVFITGYDLSESAIAAGSARATAIFLDGTAEAIEVNIKDTNKNIDKFVTAGTSDSVGYYEEWKDPATTGKTYSLNRWYTYTESKGVYTLNPVDRMFTTWVENDGSDPTHGMTIKCNSVRIEEDPAIPTGSVGSWSNENANVPATGFTARRAYGNDGSIFIVADMDTVSKSGAKLVISDVDGLYTGVQNVEIDVNGSADTDTELREKVDGTDGKTYAAYDGVYTLYDKNNFIIASVIIGDANLTCIKSAALSEEVIDDTYYWTVEAILDGTIQELTVKSEFANTIKELTVGDVMELRYDGEYVNKIIDLDASDFYTELEYTTQNTDDEKAYDIDELTVPGPNVADDLHLEGNTMYLTNDHDTYGLTFVKDAKAVVHQQGNGKRKWQEYDTVSDAIDAPGDAGTDDSDNKLGFDGRITAVLNSNGVAKWVVIDSNTDVVTGSTSSSSGDDVYIHDDGDGYLSLTSTKNLTAKQIRDAILDYFNDSDIVSANYSAKTQTITIVYRDGSEDEYGVKMSTPFKNVIFRRNGMSFFAGQHTGVYSLNH